MTSGSGSSNFSQGLGSSASGSGSLAWAGLYLSNEGITGGYAFSGTGSYDANEAYGNGYFAEFAVQDGAWAITNSGASASGDRSETYTWEGGGEYTQSGTSGSFTEGGSTELKFHSLVNEGFSSSASGSGYTSASGNYHVLYSGSGTVTMNGVQGTLETGGSQNNDWSTKINFEWQEDDFVATSGSGSNTSSVSDVFKFGGVNTSTVDGVTTTAIYGLEKANNYTQHESWNYDPTEDTWAQTDGSGSGHGVYKEGSILSHSGGYVTESYGIAGTKSDRKWDGIDVFWDYTTVFEPGASGTSSSSSSSGGTWFSSGSGSGSGTVGDQSGYSASGSIALGSTRGTYDEGGNTYNSFDYELILQLSNGVWNIGGSGSGIGNGGTHKTLHLHDSAWSKDVHDGTAVGEATLDDQESTSYEFDYQAELGLPSEGWRILSGSGSGSGGASHLRDASGSGSYARDFDEGAGTVHGTVSAVEHDFWEYSYEQVYTYSSGSGSASGGWTTTETGSGSSEGSTHYEYSGSGSYSGTTITSDATISSSGGIEESGNTNSGYDSTFSWTDADWTMTRNTRSGSLADFHYAGGTQTQTSSSSGDFAAGNGSHIEGLNTSFHDLETHSETSSSGTETATHSGSGVTGSESHSGSASGYVQTTDETGYSATWGTATINGNTSRVETGYSSNSNTEFDRTETTSAWWDSAADDGSTTQGWSSGGLHLWSDTHDQAWDIQWTETTTSGNSSGSSSGSGYSSSSGSSYGSGGGTTTTSGGNSGTSHWVSSGSSSWSASYSSSTPATPGTVINPPTGFLSLSSSESNNSEGDGGSNGSTTTGGSATDATDAYVPSTILPLISNYVPSGGGSDQQNQQETGGRPCKRSLMVNPEPWCG